MALSYVNCDKQSLVYNELCVFAVIKFLNYLIWFIYSKVYKKYVEKNI